MKVIDLLVKIAKGEEVPEKIIFLYNEFEYDKDNLKYRNIEKGKDDLFEHIDFYKGLVLNEEIEIIEDVPKENKKINKLDYCEENTLSNLKETTYLSVKERQLIDSNFKTIKEKFDEIIDKINKGCEK